jgi:PAS domain S-box-containing protein
VELVHQDRSDGRRQLRWAVEVSAAPLGGGRLVLTWHDVTDHTRLEERLRLQAFVLDRAAEGVSIVRASDATIVYANRRFSEIMGYAPDELAGRPVTEIAWELEPGDAARRAVEITTELAARGAGNFEVCNRRKDGTPVWCEAHVVSLDHPDHGKVWVSLQREMTARKAAEAVRFRRAGLRRSEPKEAAPVD